MLCRKQISKHVDGARGVIIREGVWERLPQGGEDEFLRASGDRVLYLCEQHVQRPWGGKVLGTHRSRERALQAMCAQPGSGHRPHSGACSHHCPGSPPLFSALHMETFSPWEHCLKVSQNIINIQQREPPGSLCRKILDSLLVINWR